MHKKIKHIAILSLFFSLAQSGSAIASTEDTVPLWVYSQRHGDNDTHFKVVTTNGDLTAEALKWKSIDVKKGSRVSLGIRGAGECSFEIPTDKNLIKVDLYVKNSRAIPTIAIICEAFSLKADSKQGEVWNKFYEMDLNEKNKAY